MLQIGQGKSSGKSGKKSENFFPSAAGHPVKFKIYCFISWDYVKTRLSNLCAYMNREVLKPVMTEFLFHGPHALLSS